MLHSIKLQIAANGKKTLLSCDERISDIDSSLKLLLRTFPVVQARIEENERAWGALSTSVRGMGAACRAAAAVPTTIDAQLDTERNLRRVQELQCAADALCAAGEQLPAPRVNRAHRALRALNESVRALRARQEQALAALRNREYYSRKVAMMVATEVRRGGPVPERDLQRRLRNEQKLAEAQADLALRTDRMERDLDVIMRQKDQVLAQSMRVFVELQMNCFDPSAVEPVLGTIPQADVDDAIMSCTSSADSEKKNVRKKGNEKLRPRFLTRSRAWTPSVSSSAASGSSSSNVFLTPAGSARTSVDSEDMSYNDL